MPNKNKIYEDPFISGRDVKGLKEKGNIDLTKRPIAKNSDGSISTVRSISVEFDGEHVLIPTVSDDGKVLSDEEAIEAYKKTGKHLGKFSSSEDATKYSKELHGTQALYYGEGVEQNANYTPKENVTGNPPIKLGEQMSFSPSSTWNINSELYPNPNAKYIKNSIVSPPPPPNPNTTSTQNNGEVNQNATYANWSSEDLALLMKENPKWRYEGISPFNYKNYSEYKAAKTTSNEEENSKSITDETINAIVKSMGENIKTNERDIKGNRTFNDIITLGEMANNINEPKYEGESIKEPAMMVSERISAKASLDSIDRSKAAAIKQLASVGRQDMIPSVLKEADNKKLEIQQNVGNANAQIINQERQINQQTYNQGIELGMRGSQFDAQMSSQQEQLRGAALSQNLTNLRNSSRDMTNSMTMNSDNKITYDMYIAALNDPEMMKFMQSYYSNIKRIQRETKQ
jgi:hypothetical protein